MRRLVYNVRFFVVPINSSLLTITLQPSVISTLVYNNKIFSPLHDVLAEFDCTLAVFLPVEKHTGGPAQFQIVARIV